jgi:pilus assembly protein Flp/PilA
MNKMKKLTHHLATSLARFLRREDGPTAVEYAVMLALVVVVCLAAISTLGSNTNDTFSFVGSAIAVKPGQ